MVRVGLGQVPGKGQEITEHGREHLPRPAARPPRPGGGGDEGCGKRPPGLVLIELRVTGCRADLGVTAGAWSQSWGRGGSFL